MADTLLFIGIYSGLASILCTGALLHDQALDTGPQPSWLHLLAGGGALLYVGTLCLLIYVQLVNLVT